MAHSLHLVRSTTDSTVVSYELHALQAIKIFLKILIGVQYESCGMLISAVHHEEGEEKLHLLMLDNHIPAGAKMY